MIRPRTLALVFLGFALSSSLFALDPRKALSQYTRTVWTQAQGLPQDTIRAIAQTSDGYLWVGTSEGLARFDGYDFVIFTQNNGGLPSNSITALRASHDGKLWVGTNRGLTLYSGGRFRNFTPQDGLPAKTVTALTEDHAGVLWWAAGGLLGRIENGRVTTYSHDRFAPVELGQVIYEDDAHDLWVGGAGGLVKRNGESFSKVLDGQQLGGIVTSLVKIGTRLWIGATTGIIRVDADGTRKHYDTRDGLPDNLVRTVLEDRNGNLWVGTNGGLSRLENDRFETLNADKKDDSELVWSLFEDREGDLWAGMNSSLSRFRDDRFSIYGRTEGLPSDEPIVAHQSVTGQLWLGYHNNGLVAFRPGHHRVYTVTDGLASNEIFSIRDARNGDLLIGTRGGLSRMHDGRFQNYTIPDPLGRKNVYDAIEDSTGHLWAATSNGVYESDGSSWQSVLLGDPGGRGYATALQQTRDGAIWAGMFDSGLWRIPSGGKPVRFAMADKLGSDQVRSVFEDRDDVLWVGTLGGGLSAVRDGAVHNYSARDGLLSDNISHVEDDGRGDLWLSTPRGISRISKSQLTEFTAGRLHALTPVNYGIEDGLRSAQCAPGFPTGGGATLTRDGRLWFPTGRGLATIDPAAPENHDASPPMTRIVELTVDGRPIDTSKPATLDPGTGQVQFRYAGIYLNAPERLRYAYKLEGLDRDWVAAGRRRVITYNPLPHGSYRFMVRAMTPAGEVSENAFSFDVLPRFYQTAWFLAFCGLSLLGLIYAVYQLRLRQMSGRFALVLEERARLAREIHDTLAQAFVGISSQLDALAIKLDGDLEVARQHLHLARKMARHSLTEAKRSVMDLRTSELEGQDLPAALTTSAHRWAAGSPVNVEVEISGVTQRLPEDLEQNILRIAQEAVANALKHARARKIWIELTQEAGVLLLRVKDDGQGFEPSSTFSVIGGHFGILGMRERAERLGGRFDFASRLGDGTEVEVRVPLGTRSPISH